jgi:CAAX prenyl protease-like protein
VTNYLPHLLPYVALLIGAALAPFTPWIDVARALFVAGALVWFARRGAYPELRARPTAVGVALGVVAGLAVGAAWIPLAEIVPAVGSTARTGLDPSGPFVFTAFRVAGLVLVVPFAEELIVRSALPRFVDAKGAEDWRARPIGSFTVVSAAISVGFYTVTHPEWLAALAAGLLWTVLLAKTKNLWTVVISHAVANAWLAAHVLVTGDSRWW